MRALVTLLAMLAMATWPADSPAREVDERYSNTPAERVQMVRQALEGDPSALDPMDLYDGRDVWDWFVRGYALHAEGRFDDAIRAWIESAQLGHNLAPHALAWHHYEQREWIEAYAWSRLAMEVDGALRDLDMEEMRGRWSLYNAIHSAEGLSDAQRGPAETRAQELVQRFLDPLVGPDLERRQANALRQGVRSEDIVERQRPNYPRSMAENGRPGWAYLYFEIRPDGRVGDIVSIAATDPRFARSAIRAVRKWRFNPDAIELPTATVQIIDFTMQR